MVDEKVQKFEADSAGVDLDAAQRGKDFSSCLFAPINNGREIPVEWSSMQELRKHGIFAICANKLR